MGKSKQDNGIEVHEDLTTTVMLLKPIKDGEREIHSLTFPEEATVAHLEESDNGKGEIAKAAHLMAALTQIPYPAIRKMSTRDFNRAASVLNGIMGNDQEIGGKS